VRTDRLRRDYQIDIRWRVFPLHPETPREGLSLAELFRGRSLDVPRQMLRLKAVARELGLPWSDREMTYNSRLAQELGKWAEAKGRGDEFHMAVYKAYFVDLKNIGEAGELVRLAQSVGLPGDDAEKALHSRSCKEAVDSDWALSRELGVTAVPTYLIDGDAIVGAYPYEVLEDFLKTRHVSRRAAIGPAPG
jgi:predicted DsbA family dithiol-disulfide isomerase